jgi:hypothetical protein
MSPNTVCESCAESVDPNDPTLVRARLNRDAAEQPIDGEPDVLFHAGCFPTDSPVWVRR